METKIIDGKQIAKEIRIELKKETKRLMAEGYPQPKLSVILVGNDPASETYVRNKIKACEKVGVESEQILMDASVSEEALLSEIQRLNEDPSVNGILVQLPLPKHISVDRVIETIDPKKDVDGFHIQNVGSLTVGDGKGYVPCTPGGVIELLKRSDIPIDGKQCVVVGRSNLVGKPAAILLLRENGTVTVCHSHTKNLKEICQSADILVVAIGKAHFLSGEEIKEGAAVIDVGINRTEAGLVGDVDTESCMGIAGAITPVPGGVGPMTIAMLMKNTLAAYRVQNHIQ
ncbi:MAG: bifunctional methylenetetrahydrofolate dehydrogenase/methenyltetrahydrofolate cyclohydrolase FolD [Firmicutes bacterium]|nr:bifunctional methylenetetrahydrofolate dehydrogenase/methenyltetrahydrofolate cyclohydrolase FolD [Bacillota bacterium]